MGIHPLVNLELVWTAASEPGKKRKFSPHGTPLDEHSPTWRWRKWQLPIVMDWSPFVSVCSWALRHAVVVDVCVDACVRARRVSASAERGRSVLLVPFIMITPKAHEGEPLISNKAWCTPPWGVAEKRHVMSVLLTQSVLLSEHAEPILSHFPCQACGEDCCYFSIAWLKNVSFQSWLQRGRVCPYRSCDAALWYITNCMCNYAKMIRVGLCVHPNGSNKTALTAARTVPIVPLNHDCNRIIEKGSF